MISQILIYVSDHSNNTRSYFYLSMYQPDAVIFRCCIGKMTKMGGIYIDLAMHYARFKYIY